MATATKSNGQLAKLNAAVGAQDQARQQLNYQVLGKIFMLETEKGGRIEFGRQRGPGLAVEKVNDVATGRLLLVSGWSSLPDIQEYSEAFCSDCQAVCDVCDGKKMVTCQSVGCGGAGEKKIAALPCPACVAITGRFDPACSTCGGSGSVAQMGKCTACAGAGKQACTACRGTGQRPTGGDKGSWERNAPVCATCRGTLRAGKWKPQDLSKCVVGKLGPYLAIGPVASMMIEPAEAVRGKGLTQMRVPDGEDGPLMLLLPIVPNAQQPGYFIGGQRV
jgi:hypothetical protein